MLYPELLTSAAAQTREDFQRYALEQSSDLEFYLTLCGGSNDGFCRAARKSFAFREHRRNPAAN